MSGSGYAHFVCRVCGGDTTNNGLGRISHERGKRHQAALDARDPSRVVKREELKRKEAEAHERAAIEGGPVKSYWP